MELCTRGIVCWGTLRAQEHWYWQHSRCSGQKQILSPPKIYGHGRHPPHVQWRLNLRAFACLSDRLRGIHFLQKWWYAINTPIFTIACILSSGSVPVIKVAARATLLGISGVREGPLMRLGMTVMRSMLFSWANFQAALSAKVLDAAYPCTLRLVHFGPYTLVKTHRAYPTILKWIFLLPKLVASQNSKTQHRSSFSRPWPNLLHFAHWLIQQQLTMSI